MRQPITISRRDLGTTSLSGKIIPAVPVAIDIMTSIQPVTNDQLKMEPSLRDFSEALMLITDTQLRTAKASSWEADTFELDGNIFTVYAVKQWRNGIIPHYEVYAVR